MLSEMTIKNKIKILMEQKAYRENRKVSFRVVAQEADIPLSVLSEYSANRVKRLDLKTLNKICQYFEVQDIGDLLEYVPDAPQPSKTKTARK